MVGPPLEGALAELVETERRIGARVAEATAEAEGIVQAARLQARSLAADAAGLQEEAIRRLGESIDRQCRDEIRALEEQAASQAQAYRSVSEAEIDRVAGWVLSRLVDGSSPP